jgi:hypothetical protein
MFESPVLGALRRLASKPPGRYLFEPTPSIANFEVKESIAGSGAPYAMYSTRAAPV